MNPQVTSCSDRRSANIASKNGVFGGKFVEHFGYILRMDRFSSGFAGGQIVQTHAGLAVVFERTIQVSGVVLRLKFGDERGQRGFHFPDQTQINFGASANLFSPNVDLDDGRVLRVELLIGEVGSEHQECVAIHHRVIAGGKTKKSSHADIERVVVLNKLLAA